MRIRPLCYLCKYYQGVKKDPKKGDGRGDFYCKAYPDMDGIPMDRIDEHGHFTAIDGDHGIQFSPRDDVSEEMVSFYRDVVYADEDESIYEDEDDDS